MRKRWRYVMVGAVLLLGSISAFLLIRSDRRLAAQTSEAAMVADDADDEVRAKVLFKEACHEGSIASCAALREQSKQDRGDGAASK